MMIWFIWANPNLLRLFIDIEVSIFINSGILGIIIKSSFCLQLSKLLHLYDIKRISPMGPTLGSLDNNKASCGESCLIISTKE